MKLRLKDATLNGQEMTLVADVNHRQLVSTDLNEAEAVEMFKKLPWARVLVCPKYYFFRE